jgi:hypothetical protein
MLRHAIVNMLTNPRSSTERQSCTFRGYADIDITYVAYTTLHGGSNADVTSMRTDRIISTTSQQSRLVSYHGAIIIVVKGLGASSPSVLCVDQKYCIMHEPQHDSTSPDHQGSILFCCRRTKISGTRSSVSSWMMCGLLSSWILCSLPSCWWRMSSLEAAVHFCTETTPSSWWSTCRTYIVEQNTKPF